ncbi:MAG: phospholipid-binding protein MlaC [Kiloniellales bacterium]
MRPLPRQLDKDVKPAVSNSAMVRTLLFAALLVLAPLAKAPAAMATDPGEAAKFIDSMGKHAFATLQQSNMTLAQREEAFGRILQQGFDLDLIGRFVLGKYWRQATPEQQAEYLDAFGVFVIRTYARRLGGFTGQTFSITGTSVTGEKGDILVETQIDRPSGPPILAGWRVRTIDGTLRIIDVVVEGVSMAVTQRQEFASVAQRNGIEGLVQVLRAQTERLSASAS